MEFKILFFILLGTLLTDIRQTDANEVLDNDVLKVMPKTDVIEVSDAEVDDSIRALSDNLRILITQGKAIFSGKYIALDFPIVLLLSNSIGLGSSVLGQILAGLLLSWPLILGILYLALIILYPDQYAASRFESNVTNTVQFLEHLYLSVEDGIFNFLEEITEPEQPNYYHHNRHDQSQDHFAYNDYENTDNEQYGTFDNSDDYVYHDRIGNDDYEHDQDERHQYDGYDEYKNTDYDYNERYENYENSNLKRVQEDYREQERYHDEEDYNFHDRYAESDVHHKFTTFGQRHEEKKPYRDNNFYHRFPINSDKGPYEYENYKRNELSSYGIEPSHEKIREELIIGSTTTLGTHRPSKLVNPMQRIPSLVHFNNDVVRSDFYNNQGDSFNIVSPPNSTRVILNPSGSSGHFMNIVLNSQYTSGLGGSTLGGKQKYKSNIVTGSVKGDSRPNAPHFKDEWTFMADVDPRQKNISKETHKLNSFIIHPESVETTTVLTDFSSRSVSLPNEPKFSEISFPSSEESIIKTTDWTKRKDDKTFTKTIKNK